MNRTKEEKHVATAGEIPHLPKMAGSLTGCRRAWLALALVNHSLLPLSSQPKSTTQSAEMCLNTMQCKMHAPTAVKL